MRLRILIRLRKASSPPNSASPTGPLKHQCGFAKRLRLQVDSTPPRPGRNVCMYVYIYRVTGVSWFISHTLSDSRFFIGCVTGLIIRGAPRYQTRPFALSDPCIGSPKPVR